MEVYNETVYEHEGGRDRWTISTGETKIRNHLAKLAEGHPDVELVAQNQDGSVVYHVPDGWITVRAPKRMNYSEEQRQALAERMKTVREQKRTTN